MEKRDAEIQKELCELKYSKKIELEKIRHTYIMEEIDAMKKAGIKSLVRN